MRASEASVQQQVILAAPRLGLWLMRNNVGAARDETGRLIRYGLGNVSSAQTKRATSSDLVGLHIGSGRFVAVECKHEGWKRPRTDREHAQARFIDLVRERGGIAGFATCVEDVARLLTSQ